MLFIVSVLFFVSINPADAQDEPQYISSQIGEVKRTDDRGNVIREGEFHSSLKFSGVVRKFYDNDQLKEELNYVLGIKYGPYISYYFDGQVKEKSFYIKGNLHGDYIEYHPNGKKKLEAKYVQGVIDGDVKEYSDNGKLTRKRTYQADMLTNVVLYDEKGKELK